jgi:bifunctional non-homologous end joining protein LigD
VSTPLRWDEVDRCAEVEEASLLVFETKDVLARVAEHGDLFAPTVDLEQELPRLAG